MVALARYGGLRCPSEILGMTWADILWAENRMVVRSPKTKRYEGKASRVVPIFPELRPHLETAFDQADEGQVHLVTRYRSSRCNLRTQLTRIIENAGLEPWPKLWQNLRASRATELAAEYPAHVAAAWLGHSTAVADRHYWRVTDADFERAASEPTGESVQYPVQLGIKSGAITSRRRCTKTHENTVKTKKTAKTKLPGQDSNLD